jgi:hypothetical protein
MFFIRSILLASLFLALAGCTRYVWQHPYKDTGTFNQEKAQCTQQALASYPVNMVQEMIKAGYQTQSTTNCYRIGNSVQCDTTPGRYVPPVFMNVDTNKDGRNAAFKTCLEGHGWSYVEEKK